MKNFSSVKFLLRGVCLLSILHGINGQTSQCNRPKLGPSDKLAFIFFENNDTIPPEFWTNFCKAFNQFPKGLLSYYYKAGSLATGVNTAHLSGYCDTLGIFVHLIFIQNFLKTVDNMKCGGGSCKKDQYNQCYDNNIQYSHDECTNDAPADFPKMLQCYCTGGANKILLDNSALRASLKIPETANPAVSVNNNFDPCFKFGSYEDILKYMCQAYQNQVGKCG